MKKQYGGTREEKTKSRFDSSVAELRDELLNLASSEEENRYTGFPLLNYGHYISRKIWKDTLSLDNKFYFLQKKHQHCQYNINSAVCFLSFLKVMDPSSIRHTYSNKEFFLGDPAKNITIDEIYHCYGLLKESKDSIFKFVNKQLDSKFGKERATLVFYDVTNAYFESQLTDAEKDCEQADCAESCLVLVEQAKKEGRLGSDCFDADGNAIAAKLPESFLNEVAEAKIQYLRMRGPSKEHRFDLPIVSIVLVVDKNCFPMDFEVFSGNTSEYRTIVRVIKEFKKKYNIKRSIVVADRGLNSVSNLQMLKENGLGFLVAQKVSQFRGTMLSRLLDKSLYTPFNSNNPDEGGYQIVRNWEKTGLKSKEINCTLVLTCNEKRRKRDDAFLDLMVEIVRRKQAAGVKLGQRKTGWASLAKTTQKIESPIIGVDEKLLEQKRRLSGFAAVAYDIAECDDKADEPADIQALFSGLEAVETYLHLNRIEDCFRTMKTHLGLRPMYVWNSDHIRGRITICVLVLLVLKILEYKLKETNIDVSTGKLIEILNDAKVCAVAASNDMFFLRTADRGTSSRSGRERLSDKNLLDLIQKEQITPLENEIMKAAGLTPVPRICSRKVLAQCLGTVFSSNLDAFPPELYARTLGPITPGD